MGERRLAPSYHSHAQSARNWPSRKMVKFKNKNGKWHMQAMYTTKIDFIKKDHEKKTPTYSRSKIGQFYK